MTWLCGNAAIWISLLLFKKSTAWPNGARNWGAFRVERSGRHSPASSCSHGETVYYGRAWKKSHWRLARHITGQGIPVLGDIAADVSMEATENLVFTYGGRKRVSIVVKLVGVIRRA